MSDAGVERWIGLAEVTPTADHQRFGSCNGAFVGVVADAASKRDFASLVDRELRALDLALVRLTDVEPLSDRLRSHTLSNPFEEAIRGISIESPVAFDVFHGYAE